MSSTRTQVSLAGRLISLLAGASLLLAQTSQPTTVKEWKVDSPARPAEAAQPATTTYVAAELPRAYVDTTLPASAGTCSINVSPGGDLQSAIDRAVYGDTICLQAGGTYTGNYILKNKTSGSGWITIRTNTPDSQLPPGTRVSPADVSKLAKILIPPATVSQPVLEGFRTEPLQPVHHYRLIGLEITITPGSTPLYPTTHALVEIDSETYPAWIPQSPAQQVSYIIVDRSYIHGTPTDQSQHGVMMNGSNDAVIDSYISDIHSWYPDQQAIMGYNGSGPHKIVNNYLEGASENVMFGGAGTQTDSMIPQDIEIRHNYFHKPDSWRTMQPQWIIKNLLELKIGVRVLVDSNLFDGNWSGQQSGWAIMFTVRNTDTPVSNIYDVTFTHNIVRNTERGVNLLGIDYNCVNPDGTLNTANCGRIGRMDRMTFKDNYFEIGQGNPYGAGYVSMASDADDVTFDHNEFVFPVGKTGDGSTIFSSDNGGTANQPNHNFTFTNNVAGPGPGVGLSTGNVAILSDWQITTPNYKIVNNLLLASPQWELDNYPNGYWFPPNNFLTPSYDSAGFVNYPAGDYHFAPFSPYKGKATDGTDPGANLDAIAAATAGVITGATSNPVTPAAPVISSFLASPSVITAQQSATLSWIVSGATSITVNNGVGAQTGLSSGSVSVTPPQTATYTLTAGNGGVSTTAQVSVTVNPAADITPPTVSLTAPAGGSAVSGNVSVTASASDNVGVAGVQFKLDANNVGAEDTTAPYSVNWDTTTASNGSHTLTAIARDAAGNTAISTAIVTVSNTAPVTDLPPDGLIETPCSSHSSTPCAPVSGTVMVSGWALDNTTVAESAISKVEVFVDTQSQGLATLGVSRPDICQVYPGRANCPNVGWQFNLDTTKFSDGVHVIKVALTDTDSHQTSSMLVSIPFSNPVVRSKPVISSFTITPGILKAGQSATINWVTTGATSIAVSPTGFTSTQASGSTIVAPTSTTVYSLTATNAVGSVTAQATVSVQGPTIAGIAVTGITSSSAQVTWNTDVTSNSSVEYGITSSYGTPAADGRMVATHNLPLTGLRPATTYHYRVTSRDSYGISTQSTDHTFTTAPAYRRTS